MDPELQLIFYTVETLGRVSMFHYSGERHKVIAPAQRAPRGIELDRVNRLVYWSDWQASTIQRSRYDGSERVTLVEIAGSNLNGLTLDVQGTSIKKAPL